MERRKLTTTLSLETQWSGLLLALALLFGGMVRFFPTILTGFPVLDGGMFYVAIGDILENGWRLPEVITYNQLNIPFAYPPFGFYLAAIIETITGLERITLLRFLPPIYSMLTILVMYYLASHIFKSRPQAALATVLYALLPRSFIWPIMGGGLTRAPGVIFAMLTLANLYQVFFNINLRKIWLVIVFGSLAILTHPEALLHTVGVGLWFWLAAPNKRDNLLRSVGIVAAISLITSPWWITMLARYQIDPYLAIMSTGGAGVGRLVWPLINFSEEQFLPLITLTAFLGAIGKIYQKNFLLSIWLCVPFLLSPRSAPTYAAIPVALLASLAISEFIIPAILAARDKTWPSENLWKDYQNPVSKVVVGLYLIYALLSAFWCGMLIMNSYVLDKPNQQAMQWVRENTPPQSRFLLITGDGSWAQDEVQEWFPVLAQRQSSTTLQGKEWFPNVNFNYEAEEINLLQTECPYAPVGCIENWSSSNKKEYDYVYILNTLRGLYHLPLVEYMSTDDSYPLIYTSPDEEILIFKHQK
jgi:hypothetical protein